MPNSCTSATILRTAVRSVVLSSHDSDLHIQLSPSEISHKRISVIAIISPYVPPEKLSRRRAADQHLVAGPRQAVTWVVGSERLSRVGTTPGRMRCDVPHTGNGVGGVRNAKDSLSSRRGCRSRPAISRCYPQLLALPVCWRHVNAMQVHSYLCINLWKLWILVGSWTLASDRLLHSRCSTCQDQAHGR